MPNPLPTDFNPESVKNEWVQQYREYEHDFNYIWASRDMDEALDSYGVEGSTVRAMSTGIRRIRELGPLQAYALWVSSEVLDDYFVGKAADTLPLNNQKEFEDMHAVLCTKLGHFWKEHLKTLEGLRNDANKTERAMPTELSWAHVRKLVDLLVRHLRFKPQLKEWSTAPYEFLQFEPKNKEWAEMTEEQYQSQFAWLIDGCKEFGHVPLDRKSLHVISEVYGLADQKAYSMGDVKNLVEYNAYQEMARAFVKTAGVGSPLLFDVFCWNHPWAVALYGGRNAWPPGEARKREETTHR